MCKKRKVSCTILARKGTYSVHRTCKYLQDIFPWDARVMGFSRYKKSASYPSVLQKQFGDLFVNALPLGGHRLLVDSFVNT